MQTVAFRDAREYDPAEFCSECDTEESIDMEIDEGESVPTSSSLLKVRMDMVIVSLRGRW